MSIFKWKKSERLVGEDDFNKLKSKVESLYLRTVVCTGDIEELGGTYAGPSTLYAAGYSRPRTLPVDEVVTLLLNHLDLQIKKIPGTPDVTTLVTKPKASKPNIIKGAVSVEMMLGRMGRKKKVKK